MSLTSRTPGKIKQSNLLSLHKKWVQSQEWGFSTDKDFTPRLSKNSALQSFNYPWASQILPSSSFSSLHPPLLAPLPPGCGFLLLFVSNFQVPQAWVAWLCLYCWIKEGRNQAWVFDSCFSTVLYYTVIILVSETVLAICQPAISKMMVGCNSEDSMCPMSSELWDWTPSTLLGDPAIPQQVSHCQTCLCAVAYDKFFSFTL